ncbi:GNAT family N-acetyltransferase [Parasphingopyxis marina]|uniref:GNAT family N-acetyltransferase n=1 Tax=Parasphingopyxis marina TaxID=2761622 RepID=A0A842HVK2_9SPHN|nr:GNAT family N-acetyltransferase [Parasphingopyxis marina]MBC2776992.1 GNAT family N-acetyltransferase [Parasphingopyxis marina]
MIHIRNTRPGDIPALADIERSSAALFRGTHMEFAIDHPPLGAATHEAGIAEGSHWIAEVDGARAGFCCAQAIDDLLYIAELSVGQAYQRLGLGRALMDAAIAHAKANCAGACLITDRELAWNRPFYATLGFADWDEPSAAAKAILADEIEGGFDPATRCAMILRFR